MSCFFYNNFNFFFYNNLNKINTSIHTLLNTFKKMACTFEDYAQALTIFSATLSGQMLGNPKLLSSDNEFFIPEINNVEIVECTNKNLSSTHQVVYPIETSSASGHRIKQNYISFTLPPIYASKISDRVGYCNTPGPNLISQFELKSANQASEILAGCAIEIGLKKILGIGYERFAQTHLGGIDGPNQKVELCYDYDDSPNALNIIKPAIQILLPIPLHLFRNKEKFTPRICRNTPISIVIVAKKLIQIINHNKQMKIQEPPSFELKILNQTLEHDDFFKQMFECIPTDGVNDKFLVMDKFLNFQTKDVTNKDTRIVLKSVPTTEFWIKLYDNTKAKGDLYLASTNEEARQRYWESLIKISKLNISASGSIELNKLLFINTSPSGEPISKDWNMFHIVDESDNSFILNYNLPSSRISQTIIKSTIPWKIYPDEFYIDLATWSPTNLMSFSNPFFYSNIEFNVVPYDEHNPNHKVDKEVYVMVGPFKVEAVPHGLFKFVGTDSKIYIFEGITNIKKNRKTNDFTFDVTVSETIAPITNTASVFAEQKFLNLTIDYCTSYDLSGKHKIKCDYYTIEGTNGETKIHCEEILLNRNKNDSPFKYLYDDYQIHVKYNYSRIDKDTCGFRHIGCQKWINLKPNLVEEELMWDKIPFKLNIIKDSSFLSIGIVQETLR